MSTNLKAIDFLIGKDLYQYDLTERIVEALVNQGFIEADELSEPEQYAEGAKNWIRSCGGGNPLNTFQCAAGWDSDSWKVVMEKVGHYGISHTAIFNALVILAKEAGVNL